MRKFSIFNDRALDDGRFEKLFIDNYVIFELFLREDHPEYFTKEERTFEAVVEWAQVERERVEAALEKQTAS